MARRAATKRGVELAIRENRVRVVDDVIETKRSEPKAKWRAAALQEVCAPHQTRPYHRVSFSTSEGNFRCLAHRLVWWAAGNDIPDGLEIDHINDDKRDNRLVNLRVVTRSTNIADAHAAGLHPRVKAPPKNRRFTDDQIRMIRKLAHDPEVAMSTIAETFGVSQWGVWAIASRRWYKHVV